MQSFSRNSKKRTAEYHDSDVRRAKLLLAEHSVYESLARELMNGLEERKPQRWNIVCERKEDLLSIRTQIFSLLKKLHSERNPEADFQAWTGVSLYTPDTLVRNFALTLSHNSQEQLGSEILRMLRSPFLDVVEQERMTRLLLLQLGYAGSDVAPLAKQILTLADTELPRDEGFLSVLLEVQKMSTSLKNLTDIPDVSLRTICVAYQLLQKMNSHFCRLQSFVGDYWVPIFKKNLSSSLEKSEGSKNFFFRKNFFPSRCSGLLHLNIAAMKKNRKARTRIDQVISKPTGLMHCAMCCLNHEKCLHLQRCKRHQIAHGGQGQSYPRTRSYQKRPRPKFTFCVHRLRLNTILKLSKKIRRDKHNSY